MTTLRLKYALSIIIILIHFLGCEHSWDHRIQEDFINLLRNAKSVELHNEDITLHDQVSEKSAPEVNELIYVTCNKSVGIFVAIRQKMHVQ